MSFTRKDPGVAQQPLSPLLRLNLDLSDGRHFEEVGAFLPNEWSSAANHADVCISENRCTGDLHDYRIEAALNEISIKINLTGQMPPWRPSTGYMLFGPERSLKFAWLPTVPTGAVTVTYSVDGEQHETTGVGSGDHALVAIGTIARPRRGADRPKLARNAASHLEAADRLLPDNGWSFHLDGASDLARRDDLDIFETTAAERGCAC
jgi:hypothetical protein